VEQVQTFASHYRDVVLFRCQSCHCRPNC
jgi:hypothetical protein